MINYNIIADAQNFYTSQGYEQIDAPWLVDKEIIDITKPKESRYFETFAGQLVGSGEQSFLQINKTLKNNKRYCCVTPCFRDEQITEYNFIYFLKLELIHFNPADESAALALMISRAYCFMGKYNTKIEVINTKEGKDIYLNGIEVGSYGIRTWKDIKWVYGTGIAEPRFSLARKRT